MEKAKGRSGDWLLFLVLLLGYLGVTLFLFHRQTVVYGGGYASDIPPYINHMQGIDTGYDFPYPVLFTLGKVLMLFTSPQHAMAIALTLLNGLSALVLKYYMDRAFCGSGKAGCVTGPKGSVSGCVSSADRNPAGGAGTVRRLAATLASFAMLFVSMLFPLTWIGKNGEFLELLRYKGVFSPNPYHNATYLSARPFAIVSFFLLAELLGEYESDGKQKPLKYVAFSLALLLSTMTKPSFTLVAVSTAGLVMLWRLLRSRGKGWRKGCRAFLRLGVCFIPTFLDLLYQFRGVFMGSSNGVEKGIGFGFLTAWHTAADHVPLSILLGLCFPLLVGILNLHRIKQDSCYRLSWQILAVSLLEFSLLLEKGPRLAHLNFAWGYMYGMFFSYLACLMLLMEDTFRIKSGGGMTERLQSPLKGIRGKRLEETYSKRKVTWIYVKTVLEWAAFFLHLVCGIDYFRVLLEGGLFL